ncbi:MAG: NAD(P)/FAD-dependent oxidoreductase, partial [Tetrasphaera sp.]|nr:NAD(P)/FAD-dependent oxidoreductase [Tetrasphaera sp.]
MSGPSVPGTASDITTSSVDPQGDWDAIVVGGGHNGLTAAAYLAKSGMRTLVLEQRHLVGGAAITEELRPGFSFTTFSYALSLLRPEIIQELDLVRHGFLPLMMPSSFHPTGDGDYLLFGDDLGQNLQMIRRHSAHDADAYLRYHHDLDQVVQSVQPLFDNIPPN